MQRTNVGAVERIVSVTAGGLLIAPMIKKRSLGSAVGAICGADLIWRGVTGRSPAYRALGVNTAIANKPGSQVSETAPHVTQSITIGKPPEELYAFWHEPENMSRIMPDFVKVSFTADGVSHWKMNGPGKQVFEWESRQETEDSGRKLSWQSLPGTELPNHGSVEFHPAPNSLGTEVTLRMQFDPQMGRLGAQLARVLHTIPRAIAGQTLRRFKSVMETGEIPTLEHNPSARRTADAF